MKDEPPTTYEDIRAELQDPAADTQDALADQVASETAHADANTVAEADCPEIDYPDTEFPETSEYYKAHHSRTTFGNWDVEKVHAVVAQSTFRSQNGTKHTMFRPLLEVEMSKKCTRLWREARFEVKSAKNWRVRSTFGRSDVLSRGRRKGLRTFSKSKENVRVL